MITLNVPTASAANRGALSSADWSTFNSKVGGVTATSPLASSGGTTPNITIQQSSGSQAGFLSAADWTTFNNKQAAGNYITSLTGEATASGPGAASVTLSNSAVTAKVLTGINITGGTVVDTDSILTGFGKLQNQINSLIGSTIYKGTWNASTNTPTLTSGVGTRGWYYIVSVAGTTNLDGITDWFIGDWAIFDGTAWQQVDNTDAVVSVNGQTGAVSLTTDNIPEGSTNQYFLNSRARSALSFTAGSGAYNSTTGVITIPTNNNQITNGSNYITLASLSGTAPIVYSNTTGAISITQSGTASNGYLSSTDWNTFNNKQSALTNPVTGTGTANYLPKFTGASTIGNSIAYDGGSSIGINTNAPYDNTQFKLDVNGGFIVKNTSGVAAQFVLIDANPASGGNAGFFIQSVGGTSTAAWGQIQTYYGTSIAAGALRLQPNAGQVLVGTTTGSAFMVDINGTLRVAGQLTLSSTITNGTYTYTLPGATGTIALVGGAGVGTVTSVAALTIGTTGTDLSSTVANSTTTPVITLNVPTASATNRGALSAADWTTFNNKQGALTLTTTGTSGAATLVGNTLNIPQYQSVITNPVTGTGTSNYVARWTSSSVISTGVLIDNGTNVGINETSPNNKLYVSAGSGTPGFNTGVTIKTSNGTYTSGDGGMLQFQNEDVISAGIRGVRASGWGSSLIFYVHNATAGNTFGTTFVPVLTLNETLNAIFQGSITGTTLTANTGLITSVGTNAFVDINGSTSGTLAGVRLYSDGSTKWIISHSTPSTYKFSIGRATSLTTFTEYLGIEYSAGAVTLSNLAGTGTRIVVADASGNLSATSAFRKFITCFRLPFRKKNSVF